MANEGTSTLPLAQDLTARTPPPPLDEEDEDRLLDERLAVLRRGYERQRKRKQIEALERGEDPDATPAPPAVTGEPSAKKKKGLKPTMNVLKYKGDSWGALKTFLYELNIRVPMKDNPDWELERVQYALSCFGEAVKRRWVNHVPKLHLEDEAEVPWAELERWLRKDSDDDDTRRNRVYGKMFGENGLRQTPGQKLQPFLDEFETLESELPVTLQEELRVGILLYKLDQGLIKEIIRAGYPPTYQELVLRAKRLEDFATPKTESANQSGRGSGKQAGNSQSRSRGLTQPGAKENATPESSNPQSAPTDQLTPGAAAPSGGTPRGPSANRRANITCFNCGEKGHYSSECTKPKVEPAASSANTEPLGNRGNPTVNTQ